MASTTADENEDEDEDDPATKEWLSKSTAHSRSDTGARTAVVEEVGVLLVPTTGSAAAMAVTEISAASIASTSIAAITAAAVTARRSESSRRTTETRKNSTTEFCCFVFSFLLRVVVVALPACIMVLEQFGVLPPFDRLRREEQELYMRLVVLMFFFFMVFEICEKASSHSCMIIRQLKTAAEKRFFFLKNLNSARSGSKKNA